MALRTIDAITEFLFLESPLDRADLLFVFGNDWLPTMEDVTELYKRQVSPRILVSGHSANKDRSVSEAERFAARGVELGIPESAFILEPTATNTKENLQRSLPLIAAEIGLASLSSVLFVCKAFHTRRVYMTARQFFPKTIRLGFYPMIDERNITRDNWFEEAERIDRVLAEVRRIAEYTLKGDLSLE